MAGSLALYGLLMNLIGFVTATLVTILLILTCALKIFEKKLLLLLPMGIAIGVYLAFGKLLGVHLPVGQLLNIGI
jgi:predicted exporter